MNSDTIVAVATAPGPAGVGVLRLSGPQALDVVEPLFLATDGRSLARASARCLTLGLLSRLSGEPLDEVLAVYFPAPHSFTGDLVVEIQAHGGSFHLSEIQAALLESAGRRGLDLRLA
ncbi:MAG: tRNA uridine-5-carboxymethylaminomethyl(34) synthesis GTPase MnmE, partial [bacterium]